MRFNASVAEVSAVTHMGPFVMISATVVALMSCQLACYMFLGVNDIGITWHRGTRLLPDKPNPLPSGKEV